MDLNVPFIAGYAVYSDLEQGFLASASPSVWFACLDSAVRYDTDALAWAVAKRRSRALASAVAIMQHPNGSLSWEPLANPTTALGGDWIVWLELKPGAKRLYLVRAGKRFAASNHPTDAKGYKTRLSAEKAAARLSATVAVSGIEQITAKIVQIRPGNATVP